MNKEDTIDGGRKINDTDKIIKNVTDINDVRTFEDLFVLLVGTKGRWNIMLFLLCFYCSFAYSLQTLSYQFIGYTPTYWCHIPPLIEANWTTQQIHNYAIPYEIDKEKYEGCKIYNRSYTDAVEMGYEAAMSDFFPIPGIIECTHGRDFNLSEYKSTVTIEWDLVCERRALYSTTQAASHIGNLFGAIILGYLLDTYGRRIVVLWSSLGAIILGFALAIMPNIHLFITLKVILIITTSGIYMGCFILIMETVALKERSRVGTLFVIPWALGYMILPGLAYLVRSWRWLQAILSIPTLLFISYYWLLPESPRWLILQGRHSEALEVLRKGSAMNGKTMPLDELVIDAMIRISAKNEKTNKPKVAEVLVKFFKAIIYNAEIRKRALICFFCWFTAALVYYGVSLNATNLSTNLYLYMFLGGLLEIPSYLMLWPAIIYFGRVKSLSSLYFLCAASILLVMALLLAGPAVPIWVMMVSSLLGKMAITAGFHLIWLITAELFPTSYRSLVFGIAGIMARIGSTSSPYINDLLGELITWAPSLVFGAVSLVAAGLSLQLPETHGQNMPEDDTFEVNIEKGGHVNPGFASDFSDHQLQTNQEDLHAESNGEASVQSNINEVEKGNETKEKGRDNNKEEMVVDRRNTNKSRGDLDNDELEEDTKL